MLDYSTMLYRIPALLFAITVHEYAHAVAADTMGDPTPRYAGRLSCNPMVHLDLIGALMLVVAGFGWAKPVPINSNNFQNRRLGMIKVSLAGPAANLFLSFFAAFIASVLYKFDIMTNTVFNFLQWIILYNVWFAFFNLIPIPPLDGSRLVLEFLPPRYLYQYEDIVERYGFVILIVLVATGLVGAIINPLAQMYLGLVNLVLSIIF